MITPARAALAVLLGAPLMGAQPPVRRTNFHCTVLVQQLSEAHIKAIREGTMVRLRMRLDGDGPACRGTVQFEPVSEQPMPASVRQYPPQEVP
jgi:hypothetical protein